VGQDSSFGTATRYGLEGPGSKPGGRELPHPPKPALRPTQPRVKWVPSLFPGDGVKRPGRGINHALPSSAEVKERVKLYLCSPSVPSRPVLGRTLLLLFIIKSVSIPRAVPLIRRFVAYLSPRTGFSPSTSVSSVHIIPQSPTDIHSSPMQYILSKWQQRFISLSSGNIWRSKIKTFLWKLMLFTIKTLSL
jgi:hypothetical protein